VRPHPNEGVIEIGMGAIRRVIAALVLISVIGGALVLVQQRDRLFPTAASQIDRNSYQAVFLVTNQVYFGKVQLAGEDYLLSDVFYLSQPENGTTSQLIKRGGEPHGPREPMIIPAHSVLYVENLRDDSAVVAGIKAFKAGDKGAPATAAPAATGTARPSATR
jgi:hypothetical protein